MSGQRNSGLTPLDTISGHWNSVGKGGLRPPGRDQLSMFQRGRPYSEIAGASPGHVPTSVLDNVGRRLQMVSSGHPNWNRWVLSNRNRGMMKSRTAKGGSWNKERYSNNLIYVCKTAGLNQHWTRRPKWKHNRFWKRGKIRRMLTKIEPAWETIFGPFRCHLGGFGCIVATI